MRADSLMPRALPGEPHAREAVAPGFARGKGGRWSMPSLVNTTRSETSKGQALKVPEFSEKGKGQALEVPPPQRRGYCFAHVNSPRAQPGASKVRRLTDGCRRAQGSPAYSSFRLGH